MLTFEDACALIRALPERTEIERVAVAQAMGRVLAGDVVARLDAPRHAVSAMDGYAVRDADLAECPARLRVIGPVFAGDSGQLDVPAQACVRLFTGAPVPAGLDRVVIQEHVRRDGEFAVFESAPGTQRHIRARGSDFRRGDRLLAAGTRLTAQGVVAAAGADVAEVPVFARPRVAVLSTGDELRAPGSAGLDDNGIPESASLGVIAMAEQWGARCVQHRCLPDVLDLLESAAEVALQSADVVIVTGGASVGERDFAKAMFAPHGLELVFSKVAIKPGKPVWLGRAAGRLVLGLPGNPTSMLVVARLLMAPLLLRSSGGDPVDAWRWQMASLADGMSAGGEREEFIRARWSHEGRIAPLRNLDSSAQRTLSEADVLIRRVAGTPAVEAGALVSVLPL
ncbi:molybdopterin molybdotransferase MoeA [Xanthomonadaceae bacterium JHOS43]|nr:molybdopterin molybdotransferase MoeA [Xanthomonadaceae bacterium JHOS43]MCX7563503.1 molybdopterin molybdotransferase MoeA [Xanthomonadaceae bacterium XH05]